MCMYKKNSDLEHINLSGEWRDTQCKVQNWSQAEQTIAELPSYSYTQKMKVLYVIFMQTT